ncbi:uncharacterized protein isoform X2 [Leptinotarsa decemlineata]|uniref:uncharacterized protein isoform X2 n=1 Tax=Leptinotarsa decemlineata TaxID=7539 RepID=UPI003D30406C
MDGSEGETKFGLNAYENGDASDEEESSDENPSDEDLKKTEQKEGKTQTKGNEPPKNERVLSENIHINGSVQKSLQDTIEEGGLETIISSSSVNRSWSDKERGSVESDINICISDSRLQDLKEKLTIKQRLQKLFGVHITMTQKEFDNKIRILYKCCLKSVRDLHELHLRRMMGMEIINDIIARAKSASVSMSHVIHITWSIMSCIHHFQLRLRTVSISLISYARRKKAEECMKSYSQLIRLFRPEMHRIILNAIITFYREGKLWEIEFACTDLIVQLLQIYQDAEEGIEDLLYTLETSTLLNVHEAKCLTQILYEIMKKVRWRRMSEYLMKKILSMLESSIVPKSTDNYNYVPLRKGLEICMRNTIGNLGNKDLIKLLFFILKKMHDKDLDEETIMCFGNLAAYGAKKFKLKSPKSSILDGPLPYILRLFQINNTILILYSMRIWQSLIDRNNNALNFLSPRLGLENMYQVVALTLIEIPCGYTASCFITVAMSLQEYAFSISQENLVTSHHLHATILSLLTLVCYIHNATVFYDYVNTIMERRAEWAPHLNPPLKAHYEYAQHHVLWNKPELFFEDWEARYGLWKCFRTKKKTAHRKSIVV